VDETTHAESGYELGGIRTGGFAGTTTAARAAREVDAR
jgi:hypothetical protein